MMTEFNHLIEPYDYGASAGTNSQEEFNLKIIDNIKKKVAFQTANQSIDEEP